jgi:hypothetical protein
MSTIKDPCGFMIGENHPSTLIEAQERACEIEENLASSFHQDEDFLEEVTQINQVTNFITSPPDFLHVTKAYLHKEKREVANRVVGQITSFVKKGRDQNLEECLPPWKKG